MRKPSKTSKPASLRTKTPAPKKAAVEKYHGHGDALGVVEKRCQQVKDYWAGQGYEIEAYPVPSNIRGRYIMKTNLVNGAPRGYKVPTKPRIVIHTSGGSMVQRSYREIVRAHIEEQQGNPKAIL